MVVDMGAFNLIEFVKTLGMPAPGLSVTGGVHVLQIISHSLAGRAIMFAPLDATNKVLRYIDLCVYSLFPCRQTEKPTNNICCILD